jgi:hypothetical protein
LSLKDPGVLRAWVRDASEGLKEGFESPALTNLATEGIGNRGQSLFPVPCSLFPLPCSLFPALPNDLAYFLESFRIGKQAGLARIFSLIDHAD